MTVSTRTPGAELSVAQADARAGMLAGLVAGAVYLIAQCSFAATVMHGTGWEPLQRIAAILLGPDAAPPPADLSLTIVAMALFIHLPLSALFGRFVGWPVRRFGAKWTAAAGVLSGLGLYAVNFGLLAPLLFPWFDASRNAVTALDHALFGLVSAVVFVALRRRILP